MTNKQQEEVCRMFETFTTGMQAALQAAVKNILTRVLQRQQECDQRDFPAVNQHNHPQKRNDQHTESDNEEILDNGEEIDNRFNPPNRWESSFHSDIPKLHGTLSPKDFIDWLNTVEEILMFRQVPDDMQVPLFATRFKGRAMGWRQQLK
ncbi:BnaC02g26150D [Brassica napus]|uniref:BnaC02g26150D protein n=1 Tax=Brassica napus TaxID=3708 RepID=A0A078H6R3_BRANA|nr:BnaC02g26150D [Brassica napus]